MSEAAWITIGITILGIFGTVITALITKREKPERDETRIEAACPAHSGLVSDIRALRDGQDRIEQGQRDIWDAVDEIRRDVKNMAKYKSNGGTA